MRTSAKNRHLLDGAQPNLELCSILLNLLLLLSALDPKKLFDNLASWILDPDPRFLPWTQEGVLNILDLGCWILTMSDLRFSSLNPFQT